jgi:hypothetical protein
VKVRAARKISLKVFQHEFIRDCSETQVDDKPQTATQTGARYVYTRYTRMICKQRLETHYNDFLGPVFKTAQNDNNNVKSEVVPMVNNEIIMSRDRM